MDLKETFYGLKVALAVNMKLHPGKIYRQAFSWRRRGNFQGSVVDVGAGLR
jgi:hypothetical protein